MKTCLVVDDSSVIRKVARRILEGLEFQIMEAEDGEQALDVCRKQMPDAVLLDWNMPKMDGYEFLRVLRRLPDGDRPKVVFCTTENERRAYRPRAACRRQRIHHEAVRQGHRRGQVPGSRADLTGRPAVSRSVKNARSVAPVPLCQ
jgi:two-component system, chemotaxis family, chemotaxis protein CheY